MFSAIFGIEGAKLTSKRGVYRSIRTVHYDDSFGLENLHLSGPTWRFARITTNSKKAGCRYGMIEDLIEEAAFYRFIFAMSTLFRRLMYVTDC